MTWKKDTYKLVKGETDINSAECCIGKCLNQEGIAGHTESTGIGVYYCIRELLNTNLYLELVVYHKNWIAGKTFLVQGLGNVGFWAC